MSDRKPKTTDAEKVELLRSALASLLRTTADVPYHPAIASARKVAAMAYQSTGD